MQIHHLLWKSGKARQVLRLRLERVFALGTALLFFTGCGTASPHDRAARLDALNGTAVYTWLVEHEPSRLDVSGAAPETIRQLYPKARIAAADTDIRLACRNAGRNHALLLIFVRETDTARLAAALDCGFALERDPGAVVVAPR